MRRCVLSMLSVYVLSGCAGVPSDRGFEGVAVATDHRGLRLPSFDDASADSAVAARLGKPLSADDAVMVALLRNPRLAAGAAELGLAAAELYDAGRIANPTIAAAVQGSNEPGSATRVTVGLSHDVLSVLTLSSRRGRARVELERAQLLAAHEVLGFASEIESAYFDLVGARQIASMREIAARAAEASAALARRFFEAGNINELELRREEAEAAQNRLDAVRAEADAAMRRAELNRLMGLRPGTPWTLDAKLPAPVPLEDDVDELRRLCPRVAPRPRSRTARGRPRRERAREHLAHAMARRARGGRRAGA